MSASSIEVKTYRSVTELRFERVVASHHPIGHEVGSGYVDWLGLGRTARVEVELRVPVDASGTITYGPLRLRLRADTARWLHDGTALSTGELDAVRARLRGAERSELLLTSVYFEVEP